MLSANGEDKQSVENPPRVQTTDHEQRSVSLLILRLQDQHKHQVCVLGTQRPGLR